MPNNKPSQLFIHINRGDEATEREIEQNHGVDPEILSDLAFSEMCRENGYPDLADFYWFEEREDDDNWYSADIGFESIKSIPSDLEHREQHAIEKLRMFFDRCNRKKREFRFESNAQLT